MTQKEVIVSITGSQTTRESFGEETVDLVTSGVLRRDGDDYTLMYQEADMSGETQTTLLVQGSRVTILRSGEVTTQMVFEEGRKHFSYYDTHEGSLLVGINAGSVRADLSEHGGDIFMDYMLEIDHAVAGENRIRINVREAPDQTPAFFGHRDMHCDEYIN
jgi:uncharacterized beta-barrel protein YwiB (DUF1934 family)